MKRSISLALSTSVALGVLAVPGTAFAAEGPTALEVGGHDRQLGHLFVDDLAADSEITDVTAVVHRPGEDAALETVHDFQLASGDRKKGDWLTKGEVRLGAAGTYAVDLVVKEADGDETTLKNAGTYDYRAKKYFEEFGVDRPRPTVDDMKVTASGRLVEWQPVTHERKPVADSSIRLHSSTDITDVDFVKTDADGRFSEWFIAEDRPVPVYGVAYDVRSETVTVAPKGLPARVTLDKSDFSGVYNAPVTVTGKVEYQLDGVWKPAEYADADITDASGLYAGRGFTRADGTFSAETKIPFVGEQLRLTVSNGEWFSNKPSTPLTFRTTGVSSISGFTVELGSDSRLTASGSLEVEGAPRPLNTVDIQTSKNGKDGWRKLRSLKLQDTWGHFREDVPAPPTGYYRAVYHGSPNVRGVVSPVLYAGRAETRIKDFKVSPTVKKGRSVVVSGTLLHRTPSWQAYGNKKVLVFFSPKGKPKESYLMGEVKSAANGTFKGSFKERGDGTVFALHIDVDDKHLMNAKVTGNVDVK
ncbi:hypothetical protein ACFU5O_16495 [Streptomyces sp. NPDC057445]|uniref:hypothetical protein n=1 Tax=Streptomyces sp. NPDC057445 TaxID=3346136 RepID=UPI0036C3274B